MAGPRKRANGQGTVYRDKARSRPGADVWRIAVYPPGSDKPVTERFRGVKSDALDRCADMKRELSATGMGRTGPRRVGRQAWTVGLWMDYWHTTGVGKRKGVHGTGMAPKSLNRERWAVGEITRALGDIPLRTLTTADVSLFLAERAAGIGCERRPWKVASCQNVKNLGARAYDMAIRDGYAPAPNKFRDAAIPEHAADAAPRFALSKANAQRLYHACLADGTTPALVLALQLATGLRPGEARTMQWGRVDLDGRTLRIDRAHAKRPNSIRTLHLADTALVVLRAAAARAELSVRDKDAYVFPGLVRSAYVDDSTLAAKLDALAEAAGVSVNDDDARLPNPHEMRHTFASHLLEAGESSRKVARMLGDTVGVVEKTYAHILSPVAGDEAAAVHVDAMLSVVSVAS